MHLFIQMDTFLSQCTNRWSRLRCAIPVSCIKMQLGRLWNARIMWKNATVQSVQCQHHAERCNRLVCAMPVPCGKMQQATLCNASERCKWLVCAIPVPCGQMQQSRLCNNSSMQGIQMDRLCTCIPIYLPVVVGIGGNADFGLTKMKQKVEIIRSSSNLTSQY